METAKRFVPYYRVSTRKQGVSGLGLEAQQSTVERYVNSVGGTLVANPAYIEVESGKRADRPKLALAMAHAKAIKATLIVAKLDRLARNVHFLSGLIREGVEFVVADNPGVTKLTLHILASVAEEEAELASKRTKAGLEAARRRGVKLGAHRPEYVPMTAEARAKGQIIGGQKSHTSAMTAYGHVRPICAEMRAAGATYQAIAAHLNAEQIPTRRGKLWSHVQVMNVLNMASA